MNILIAGETGVGKTSLINRILKEADQPIFGFRTEKRHCGLPGVSKVYINPANGPFIYSDANTVGVCKNSGARANNGAFDRVGVPLLAGIPDYAVVLMDELGVLESDERVFCDTVLKMLNGNYLVLAAVKLKMIPFLQEARASANSKLYTITIENRDDLFPQVKENFCGYLEIARGNALKIGGSK